MPSKGKRDRKNLTKPKPSSRSKRTGGAGGNTSRTKAPPKRTLVKRLDSIFSQFIRLRAVDETGHGNCYTCGSRRHFSEVHCGHFMSRACMSTRWEPTNCAFQCARCNCFRSGEQYIFGQNLDRDHGEGTAERLHIESKKTKRWTSAELQDMCHHYKRRVDELKRQKGL